MSEARRLDRFWESVANRWQVPLLGAAGLLLLGGLLQLRPDQPNPSFAQYQDEILSLQRAGLTADAVIRIDTLLGEEGRTASERGWLYERRAESIYLLESSKRFHEEANLRGILDGYDRARLFGAKLSGEALRQLGDARKWLGDSEEAIRSYQEALSAGVSDIAAVRRDLVALMMKQERGDGREIQGQLDEVIKASGDRPDMQIWAIGKKFQMLVDAGNEAEAEKLLSEHQGTFASLPVKGEFDYLLASLHYHAKRYDEAERLLRVLRSQLRVRDELDAKSGWLLGMVNLHDDRPQMALSLFEEVLSSHPDGPYVTACKFGQAECLAALQRYRKSLDLFAVVLNELREHGENPVVDTGDIRESLTGKYEILVRDGEPELALSYLEMATGTIPRRSESLLVAYVSRLAGLYSALAERRRAEAEEVSGEGAEEARQHLLKSARAHFIAAGDAYLRSANLNAMKESLASEETWLAADHYDQAGEGGRATEVLETFVRERPSSEKIPEALFRLGQAYQAQGRWELAIDRYRRNQQLYPRTLSALRSLVPMADCYRALERFQEAEETLLLLVEDSKLVSPEAAEFKAALFALSELYSEEGAYEKAIRRLEEVLARYPEEEGTSRSRFLLADAYRKSSSGLAVAAADGRNAEHKKYLIEERRLRLTRSVELFDEVATTYDRRPDGPMELVAMYVELSRLYRADGLFDLGHDEEALRAYREVMSLYPNSPAYLAAGTQVMRIHLRAGRVAEARATLWNARTRLAVIPKAAFESRGHGRSAEGWRLFLDLLTRIDLLKEDPWAEGVSSQEGDS